MWKGSGLYETVGDDLEGPGISSKSAATGGPGSIRRAAALVGHHPWGGSGLFGCGDGPVIALGNSAGEQLVIFRFFDLWSFYDGAVHRQYALPLFEYIGGRPEVSAEI